MGTNYGKHFNTRKTTQEQKLPGSKQVKNSDGFYVYAVDIWKRLDRFLILGSEGGSFYASEQTLTVDNAENVVACIQEDGVKAVDRIAEISRLGRAPKNDPAIFALAIAAKLGNEETRRAAFQALPVVCRIPTHLFHFADYAEGFGGWGRAQRRAVASWYTDKPSSKLAYHLAKYQQRDGWSNRDLLRLSHAKPATPMQNTLFHWVTQGSLDLTAAGEEDDLKALRFIGAFEQVKRASSVEEVVGLINEYNLTREMVPTQFLSDRRVWEALLNRMPVGAMVRNLGNMSKHELLVPFSEASKLVVDRLQDGELLRKARMHPLQLLTALKTYESGTGFRGGGGWTPVPKVLEALEKAFYLAFENIEPSGKRHLLCLDTSGSMTFVKMAGMPNLTPRDGSAVMAMVTTRTEPESLFISYSDTASELPFTGSWNLQAVLQRLAKFPAYGTNCAAPIELAIKRGYDVDTIILYTDSETNARGKRQPVVALRDLRQKLGHDVKFIVVGMTSNGFSVADPDDASMLDCVGFSTDTPAVISEFSAGRI